MHGQSCSISHLFVDSYLQQAWSPLSWPQLLHVMNTSVPNWLPYILVRALLASLLHCGCRLAITLRPPPLSPSLLPPTQPLLTCPPPPATPTGPMAKLRRSTSSLKETMTNAKGKVKDAIKGRKGTGGSQPDPFTVDPKPDSISAGAPARRQKMKAAVASVRQKLTIGRRS